MISAAIEIERVKGKTFTGIMDRHEFKFHKDWSTLTWKELKRVSSLLVAQPAAPQEVTPLIILELLPLPKKAKRSIDIENYAAMYDLVGFIFKKMNWKASKQPSSWFMKTPSSLLANFTFDQLITCDNYLAAYEKNREKKHIRKLCAAMCTLFGRDFKFSSLGMKTLLMRFYREATLLAMYQNYTGLRNAIGDKYNKAFSKPSSGSLAPPSPNDPWLSLRVSLAGDKFGNPDAVGATKVHNILIHLHDSKIDQERREREAKNRTAR